MLILESVEETRPAGTTTDVLELEHGTDCARHGLSECYVSSRIGQHNHWRLPSAQTRRRSSGGDRHP